jgi:hypothetical protein
METVQIAAIVVRTEKYFRFLRRPRLGMRLWALSKLPERDPPGLPAISPGRLGRLAPRSWLNRREPAARSLGELCGFQAILEGVRN